MSLFRGPADRSELLALQSRVATLEEQVARLEEQLQAVREELPSRPPDPTPGLATEFAVASGPELHAVPAAPEPPDQPSYAEARALAAEGSKIHAIQLVIEETGMSLKAARDLVDSW